MTIPTMDEIIIYINNLKTNKIPLEDYENTIKKLKHTIHTLEINSPNNKEIKPISELLRLLMTESK